MSKRERGDDVGRRKESATAFGLGDPRYVLPPENLLDFIELPQFTKRRERLELGDAELLLLQFTLMLRPRAGKVIKGTRSLRKLRFAPESWKKGKSGAVRVLYVFFERFGVVVLCLAYGKNEAEDISAAGKIKLNRLVAEIETELERRRSNS